MKPLFERAIIKFDTFLISFSKSKHDVLSGNQYIVQQNLLLYSSLAISIIFAAVVVVAVLNCSQLPWRPPTKSNITPLSLFYIFGFGATRKSKKNHTKFVGTNLSLRSKTHAAPSVVFGLGQTWQVNFQPDLIHSEQPCVVIK